MVEQIDIKIQKIEKTRIGELDFNNIPFGKIYSDHMFTADYIDGKWANLQITPYKNLSLSPATSAIHYGQSIFEGMKAHKTKNGNINVFRAIENAHRLNHSAKRMCMPELPVEIFMEALDKLICTDNQWIPSSEGTSLYIRPFMFATDAYIGVKPSETYKFMIFTCPVGKYYSEPVKVKFEEHYSRSMKGGVGSAKAAGNYGAALYPAKMAQLEGYHQLIWTDSIEHKYIEESGTMNICFIINDALITPPSSDTILSGITRRSIVQIAKDKGYKVEERPVLVSEIHESLENGTLQDAFGAGTAATLAHIDTINYRGKDYKLPSIDARKMSLDLASTLTKIKTGEISDIHNWNHIIHC